MFFHGVMMMIASWSSCCSIKLCSSALMCQLLSPTYLPSFSNSGHDLSLFFVCLMDAQNHIFLSLHPSHLFFASLSAHSFWFPVQWQVRLQHRAAHFKRATWLRGECSGHSLPPRSGSCADGQLHRTRLHNWGHGHLSGKVRQELPALSGTLHRNGVQQDASFASNKLELCSEVGCKRSSAALCVEAH